MRPASPVRPWTARTLHGSRRPVSSPSLRCGIDPADVHSSGGILRASLRLDPIGLAREVRMDLVSDVFGEKALRDPDLRLPRDRGGTEHRARAFRVINVIGLEE